MFTPIETGIGAVLLQQATSNLLYHNGATLGASGFVRSVLYAPTRNTVAFFVGMGASFLPLKLFVPALVTQFPPSPTNWQQVVVTAIIGLLTGWGTRVRSAM